MSSPSLSRVRVLATDTARVAAARAALEDRLGDHRRWDEDELVKTIAARLNENPAIVKHAISELLYVGRINYDDQNTLGY